VIDDPRAWLEHVAGAPVPPDAELVAVRRSGHTVGVVVWSHWYHCDGAPVDAEVTLHMQRPATPALIRGILRYSFNRLRLDRVTVHPMTDASRRLGELMGFQKEGTKRGAAVADADIYGLTAHDFRQRYG